MNARQTPMYKLFRELFRRYPPESVQKWGEEHWPELCEIIRKCTAETTPVEREGEGEDLGGQEIYCEQAYYCNLYLFARRLQCLESRTAASSLVMFYYKYHLLAILT